MISHLAVLIAQWRLLAALVIVGRRVRRFMVRLAIRDSASERYLDLSFAKQSAQRIYASIRP
jgi:hypothetical protein